VNVRPRRGVFWPLLLIALGFIFLLQNFGFISGVSWLAVASLWPLLLVLIGLDIAFARRWPLPTLAAEVAVIAAGLALVAYSPNLSPGIFVFADGNGPGETDVSVPRGSATQLSLTLNGGATRSYHVSGGATQLVEAHSANPDLRLRTSGATRADVRLDQASEGFFHPVSAGDVEIRVASDVPTSLTINLGAGEFDVDLSNVLVTDARVNIGASSMRFVLPKPSGEVAIRMNGGASSVTLVVPDGVEARIATTGGLLSLRSDNTRLGSGLGSGLGGPSGGCVTCGSSVETSGYAAAHDRVTVTISAGVSSIVVR
jgi:cell wall-active antibiotic response 4TMS protein YvqF